MKKQLTQENIQELFSFVQSKYVRWQDVQFEIVDHLASAIEDLQENDPGISFNQGLKQVYSTFPITGFTNLVAAKEKAVYRYWWKRIGIFLIRFLKLPRIIFTLCLMMSIYVFLISFPQISPKVLFGLFIVYVVFLFFQKRKTTKLMQQNQKFLVVKSLLDISQVMLPVAITFPLNFLMNRNYEIVNTGQAFGIAILFTFLILFDYICTYHFPDMLKNEIEEKYRHLNIGFTN